MVRLYGTSRTHELAKANIEMNQLISAGAQTEAKSASQKCGGASRECHRARGNVPPVYLSSSQLRLHLCRAERANNTLSRRRDDDKKCAYE
jgi:hypothetical protein